MDQALWTPDPARVAGARITAFMAVVGKLDYDELYRWSLNEPEAFWRAVWDFTGVIGDPGKRVLEDSDKMPGARWFPDAQLNFAENLLRRRDGAPAIILRREDGLRREMSFRDLYDEVARLQAAFKQAGLKSGDRVAAFVPNIPEAISTMLAVTSLGAIWSSASPDFGVEGVVDRFSQIEPRFLLVADGYRYKNNIYSSKEKLRGVLEGLPTVERTLVIAYTEDEPDFGEFENTQNFRDFVASCPLGEMEFPCLAFDHPLYILFSSGTTGKPKCITHGAGGTLLQHLKEHQLHTDLASGDRFFYFTTTGWMMWNWLVSGLATGATLVLFDGNPFYPGPEVLWDMADEEKLDIFGTGAKYIDACKKAGVSPARSHDLTNLRTICSTGSPLTPESFDYVYEHIKGDLQLASIAGGTDIVSCFMLGCPVTPVWRGEIQVRGLGMAVEVFDAEGHAIEGEPGELVCTKPAPSMPIGFWGDDDGSRYRAAYFERYDNVWHHGDLVELTGHGGILMYGRSDATLNPGGVRIGTAEIYRQVEKLEEVEEAVVVGQPWDGDERVLLFVRLREGMVLDEALVLRIKRQIRDNTTPRHVPAVLAQVEDIPRTRSGKISEIAVRDVIHGREIANTEALANPEALEYFRNWDS